MCKQCSNVKQTDAHKGQVKQVPDLHYYLKENIFYAFTLKKYKEYSMNLF